MIGGIRAAVTRTPLTMPTGRAEGDRYRSNQERRTHVCWDFCYSMIGNHSRLANSELHGDERADTVTGFIERAVAFFAGHRITARRIQTDNAWTYVHNWRLRELLAADGIQHRRIPPRTPKRNGKVEPY